VTTYKAGLPTVTPWGPPISTFSAALLLVAEVFCVGREAAALLAWLVAVLIRVATGSATVATITAAGIMAPIAQDLGTTEVSLLVLAIGAGSVFFSHVNDAGFWLVKEFFGLSVVQTVKSWSIMETILSVTGLVVVLALNAVV
jgi:GntP family gluconate:H+ symporter